MYDKKYNTSEFSIEKQLQKLNLNEEQRKQVRAMIEENISSANADRCNNIYEVLEDLQTRIGDQLIPFAEDSFGNLLCFDYSAEKSIVFWNHEKNYDKFKEATFVCSSFSSLIESLF